MKNKLKKILNKYNITDVDKIFWISMVFVLLAMICITSCSPSIYQYRKNFDQPVITHVLALTDDGDTVQIPISEIRPRTIYNVVGYDYSYPYNMYRNEYQNYWRYTPNNAWRWNSYGQPTYSQGWHPLENFATAPRTPVQIPVGGSNNYSGTSGFSGNPVASNPVTSGGMKTKN